MAQHKASDVSGASRASGMGVIGATATTAPPIRAYSNQTMILLPGLVRVPRQNSTGGKESWAAYPSRATAISDVCSSTRGQAIMPPPIWLMRQAGRYLPEYREVRAKAGGFLDLCYSPAFVVGATAVVRQAQIQPFRYPWIVKLRTETPAKDVAIRGGQQDGGASQGSS
jgi:hypothetical protein